MKLDYGFTEYNTEKAKPIFSWKSLLDYDHNSSSLELADGDHYTIYKDDKGSYFLYCAERVLSIAAGETPNAARLACKATAITFISTWIVSRIPPAGALAGTSLSRSEAWAPSTSASASGPPSGLAPAAGVAG